jgi:hypothetical protein
MLLVSILILFSCQFKPVYKSENINFKLCSIKVDNEKNPAALYEITFKNELKSILCTKQISKANYFLKWTITKNYRELIKSESNSTRRYEETLRIKFAIFDSKNNTIVYSDIVAARGAYNVLEDELISTIASKKAVELQIATIAARLILDKIHLFMLKNENSEL